MTAFIGRGGETVLGLANLQVHVRRPALSNMQVADRIYSLQTKHHQYSTSS